MTLHINTCTYNRINFLKLVVDDMLWDCSRCRHRTRQTVTVTSKKLTVPKFIHVHTLQCNILTCEYTWLCTQAKKMLISTMQDVLIFVRTHGCSKRFRLQTLPCLQDTWHESLASEETVSTDGSELNLPISIEVNPTPLWWFWQSSQTYTEPFLCWYKLKTSGISQV